MTFLETIAESRAGRVREARRTLPVERLRDAADQRTPLDAYSRMLEWPPERRAVIAEIKRRSPSKGPLRPDLHPAELGRAYAEAGAYAISVLTEPDFFGGSLEDLRAVRGAVEIPLLYKDFVVDPYQLWEARANGADLVLLIAALLGERTGEYVEQAKEVGLEPLVEVHDGVELDLALSTRARFIGVNNRNLKTFEVDLQTSRELLPRLPPQVIGVAESGLRNVEDLCDLAAARARAYLIGEAFVTAPEPAVALRRLIGRGAVRP